MKPTQALRENVLLGTRAFRCLCGRCDPFDRTSARHKGNELCFCTLFQGRISREYWSRNDFFFLISKPALTSA